MTTSAIGFIFWIIAAKYYTPEEIGVATAVISTVTLIALISRLGFDQSMIRFFPKHDKSAIFITAFVFTTLLTFILGVIFLFGIDLWAPKLSLLKGCWALFMVILLLNSLVLLIGFAFVALRRAKFFFFQNVLIGTRAVLLIPFALFGALGIFYSFGLSILAAVGYSLIILSRFNITLTSIDIDFLKKTVRFSIGNYLSTLLITAPTLILPLMVLNIFDAETTGVYYITFSIASLLFMVSQSFSTSLFVESSNGASIRKSLMSSIKSILVLLIPAVVLIYSFGNILLELIGVSYADGFVLLKVLSLSSFLVAVCNIFLSIQKIQMKINSLMVISFLLFSFLIAFSYIFMPMFGIVGAGYAWLLGYGLVSIIALLQLRKEELIMNKLSKGNRS